MANNVIFRAGDVIFREGDQADAFYVVRSGKIRISQGDTVLDDLGRNAFFGEMALIDDGPRSATATALEESECVQISAADFAKRLHHIDPVMQGVFRVLVERIRTLNRRVAEQETQDC